MRKRECPLCPPVNRPFLPHPVLPMRGFSLRSLFLVLHIALLRDALVRRISHRSILILLLFFFHCSSDASLSPLFPLSTFLGEENEPFLIPPFLVYSRCILDDQVSVKILALLGLLFLIGSYLYF